MMSGPLMSSSSSAYALKKDKLNSWLTMPPALCLTPPPPSASLGHRKAPAAPTHPGAKPEHLGGLPRPPEPG